LNEWKEAYMQTRPRADVAVLHARLAEIPSPYAERLWRDEPLAVPVVANVSRHCGLTRRERDVLALLCLRLTDREIGEHLVIGVRTVQTHVSRILEKLGAANRREAAAIATRFGFPGAEASDAPFGISWSRTAQRSRR
jgi:DNA-binding NarL/FixJ family response regulator